MSPSPSLESLNDRALLAQFVALVRQDHEGNANLLRHIDAIDQRKLWAKLGHPSMFDFLVTRHHMSESTAGKRIGAARTARRFPVLFGMVARGELHLSGIHRLKAHLTLENHRSVLEQAKHKTIRQIEVLVAHLAPQPDVPSRLRALPNRTAPVTAAALASPEAVAPTLAAPAPVAPPLTAPAPAEPPLTAPAMAILSSPAQAPVESTAAVVESAPAQLPPRRDPDPTPLAPGRWKLQVTISQSSHDKLEQLQALLAHKIPNGDPAAIIERAIDALLTQVQKRKTGMTEKPRASKPTRTRGRTRHVAAAARREVWLRDDGRCGFVGDDGHRCNETRGLQLAHIEPWAKGGANTADNLGLRCPAHNALEADRDYGASFMANKRKQKPLRVQEPVARYRLHLSRFARL